MINISMILLRDRREHIPLLVHKEYEKYSTASQSHHNALCRAINVVTENGKNKWKWSMFHTEVSFYREGHLMRHIDKEKDVDISYIRQLLFGDQYANSEQVSTAKYRHRNRNRESSTVNQGIV